MAATYRIIMIYIVLSGKDLFEIIVELADQNMKIYVSSSYIYIYIYIYIGFYDGMQMYYTVVIFCYVA